MVTWTWPGCGSAWTTPTPKICVKILSRRPRTAAGHAGSANDPATCCREVLRGWHGWLEHPPERGEPRAGIMIAGRSRPHTAGSPMWPAGTPARLDCRPAGAGFGWLNAKGGAGPRHVARGHPVSHQRCVAPDAPRQPRRRRRYDQRSVAVNSPDDILRHPIRRVEAGLHVLEELSRMPGGRRLGQVIGSALVENRRLNHAGAHRSHPHPVRCGLPAKRQAQPHHRMLGHRVRRRPRTPAGDQPARQCSRYARTVA